MKDLLQKCIEQEQAKSAAASRPPPVPAKDGPVRKPVAESRRAAPAVRGQKTMKYVPLSQAKIMNERRRLTRYTAMSSLEIRRTTSNTPTMLRSEHGLHQVRPVSDQPRFCRRPHPIRASIANVQLHPSRASPDPARLSSLPEPHALQRPPASCPAWLRKLRERDLRRHAKQPQLQLARVPPQRQRDASQLLRHHARLRAQVAGLVPPARPVTAARQLRW